MSQVFKLGHVYPTPILSTEIKGEGKISLWVSMGYAGFKGTNQNRKGDSLNYMLSNAQ